MIMAKSGDALVGTLEHSNILSIKWYRVSHGNKRQKLLQGVSFYQPSINDVGNKIAVTCKSLKYPSLKKTVEYGPVVLDAALENRIQESLSQGNAQFEVFDRTHNVEQVATLDVVKGSVALNAQNMSLCTYSPEEDPLLRWVLYPGDPYRVLFGSSSSAENRVLVFRSCGDRDVCSSVVLNGVPDNTKVIRFLDEEDPEVLLKQALLLNAELKRSVDLLRGEVEEGKRRHAKDEARLSELESLLRSKSDIVDKGKALAEVERLSRVVEERRKQSELAKKKAETWRSREIGLNKVIGGLEEELVGRKSELRRALGQLEEQTKEMVKSRQLCEQIEVEKREGDNLRGVLEEDLKQAGLQEQRNEEEKASLKAALKASQLELQTCNQLAEELHGQLNSLSQVKDSLSKDLARMLRVSGTQDLDHLENVLAENMACKARNVDLEREVNDLLKAGKQGTPKKREGSG